MIVGLARKERGYFYLCVIFAIFCAAIFVIQKIEGHPRAPLALIGFLFLLLPKAAYRILRLKFGLRIKTLVLLFCLFAYNLGVALDWYHRFRFYDDLMHTLSGVLFTLIGLCIAARMEDVRESANIDVYANWPRRLAFAFCFSLAVALIWEAYEFGGYLMTGIDMQNHETTGVFDTMTDMVVCVAGSIYMALDYLYCVKKRKKSFFIGCFEEFLELNSPKASSI